MMKHIYISIDFVRSFSIKKSYAKVWELEKKIEEIPI